MANRKIKPTSPGRRFATYQDRTELTEKRPHKPLTDGLAKSGGRNGRGRITTRHRGGGAKRRYRRIDFKRRKDGVPARVATIEYDPNRTCFIALLHYADGDKRYILAPQGLVPGATVESGDRADIRPGNSLQLAAIPTGTVVHNAELVPGQGARLGRAAGSAIQVVAKEGDMVTLRLPSTEVRMVRAECRATIGALSNAEHQNVKLGKAGRKRHLGQRPQTRGVAMNPVDHPHGGGEAHHTPGGHPVTPWGKPTLGYRTRKKGKQSDAVIVRGRRRGKKKGGSR
jgi:large subunit ribosomal protein L2